MILTSPPQRVQIERRVAAPSTEQSEHAALLIRTMVNAAKSDGAVDQKEQEKIGGQLGDSGQEEAAFIRAEMSQPLDVQGFIKSVPRGMAQQVYLLSLMSIDLDSKAEAEYLDTLAKGPAHLQQCQQSTAHGSRRTVVVYLNA